MISLKNFKIMSTSILIITLIFLVINSSTVISYSTTTTSPKILYIYKNDYNTGLDYQKFLKFNGYSITLLDMNNIENYDISDYDIIMIGHDTANSGNIWGTSSQFQKVSGTSAAIIGFYKGGAVFFGNLGSHLGWDNTMLNPSTTSIKIMKMSGKAYNSPYSFTDYTVYTIYCNTTDGISVNNPNNLSYLENIGRHLTFTESYSVIIENSTYVLWGFKDGPINMTYNGEYLFLNILNYLVSIKITTTTIPGFEFTFILFAIISCLYIWFIHRKISQERHL
ncbi:MAG: hypothetical protein ACTSPQ_19870 [Candidatus Helarchaeota archaeon]